MKDVKGSKNIFSGAKWKEASYEEQSKVFATLAKIQKSVKKSA